MIYIGILKEQNGDPRVCMIPDTVRKLKQMLACEVIVEEQAGSNAGFTDEAYMEAGAQILRRDEVFKKINILLCIHPFETPVAFREEVTVVSVANPLFHYERILPLLERNLRLFSLDLIPRTTKAQSMDVLSSMAALSGYKAVIKGAELFNSVLPMFTTAAGTVRPAKVLVLGAGVAGLQAIATARRLGAIVNAFDVRSAAGEEVRSLGAGFIEVDGAVENQQAGGYAVAQSTDYLERQRELIDHQVSEASLVISTANIPGKRAPLLIETTSVEKMKPGAVIIDLASEQGGNCALTQDGQLVEHRGVRIVGNSLLSAETALTASLLLSNNYFNFLRHLFEVEKAGISDDPIVTGCLVISKGKIVSERVKSFIQ